MESLLPLILRLIAAIFALLALLAVVFTTDPAGESASNGAQAREYEVAD
jgi:uncharacterized membrane protein